jgi:hypothetical protein
MRQTQKCLPVSLGRRCSANQDGEFLARRVTQSAASRNVHPVLDGQSSRDLRVGHEIGSHDLVGQTSPIGDWLTHCSRPGADFARLVPHRIPNLRPVHQLAEHVMPQPDPRQRPRVSDRATGAVLHRLLTDPAASPGWVSRSRSSFGPTEYPARRWLWRSVSWFSWGTFNAFFRLWEAAVIAVMLRMAVAGW